MQKERIMEEQRGEKQEICLNNLGGCRKDKTEFLSISHVMAEEN
jgi:hypothetical protein